jgi:hypothetical protein
VLAGHLQLKTHARALDGKAGLQQRQHLRQAGSRDMWLPCALSLLCSCSMKCVVWKVWDGR